MKEHKQHKAHHARKLHALQLSHNIMTWIWIAIYIKDYIDVLSCPLSVFLRAIFQPRTPYPHFSKPFSLFLNAPNLHAIQCSAGTAHTAGSEAALLWQRPVTQGEQLTAQTQILPAQPRLKATLGILAEQLAAPADVLRAELGERRCAVSIVPKEKTKRGRKTENKD